MPNSGNAGRLVNTSIPRNPAVTASACGREKSCWMNCARQIGFGSLLRVTSKPAASEIRNAGTWLTRPSPIVELREQRGRLADAHAVLDHADDQPADDVDQRDDDAGDGVAADELAGTVHRAEEIGLLA